MVASVLPLGELGVFPELLRARCARSLNLPGHRGEELDVIPPRVVEHVGQRTFPRAAGVIFWIYRLDRHALHGHVGVELPQQIQPRAELADGRALDVLLEREGHLAEALGFFLGEPARVELGWAVRVVLVGIVPG